MILFDLNGTIFDDQPLCFSATSAIFDAFGKKAPSVEYVFRVFSGDYLSTYRAAGITAERDDLNLLFQEHYRKGIDMVALFPGVRETLEVLCRRFTIGIVSAQLYDLAIEPLLRLGISNYFRYQSFHVLDKAAELERLLQLEKEDPVNCWFVGDAPADIRHGRRAGVKTIAFLSGRIPNDLLLAEKPTCSIRQFAELTEVIT